MPEPTEPTEPTGAPRPDEPKAGDEPPVPEAVRLRALAAVSAALVGATTELSLDAVLQGLVCGARSLVGARYAALGVPDGEGGFARFITDGMDDELVASLGPLPRSHGMLDAMLTQATPYRTPDIRQDPRFRGWWPARHPDMRSFLGYPILLRGDVIGAFYLTDKVGADAFDETDEQLVSLFAPHAAVLVEHARLYEESRELSVAGERDRIARELHDALTQTLFGARLAVQTATHALGDEPDIATAVERLGRASRLLDEAFGELRALIFDLRPPDLANDGLDGALRKQLDLLERTSDLTVELELGSSCPELPAETERQLFRIVQEAVANVVRHAGATKLTVGLRADDGSRVVRVTIQDDGVGFDPSHLAVRSRRLGLTSMFERARALGGRLHVDSAPGQGTRVTAEVPMADNSVAVPNQVIRVVVADDHPVVREGLRSFLSSRPGIEVVGEAGSADEVVGVVGDLRPDVVLVDLMMPGGGIEAIGRVRALADADGFGDPPRLLVLTSFVGDDQVLPALRAGASGYLLKDVDPADLEAAVRTVHRGGSVLGPAVAPRVLDRATSARPAVDDRLAELTPRERDVLGWLGQGMSNRQIADALFVAEKTVKTHMSSILTKLRVHDRTQAALYAARHGVTAPES